MKTRGMGVFADLGGLAGVYGNIDWYKYYPVPRILGLSLDQTEIFLKFPPFSMAFKSENFSRISRTVRLCTLIPILKIYSKNVYP